MAGAADAQHALDTPPLTERHEQVIGAAAIATAAQATRVLEELLQQP